MLDFVFSRIGNPGVWRRAVPELCELPLESRGPSDLTQQLLTVAGGVALVLSRCPKGYEKRHYPSTTELYTLIRSGLRKHGRVKPSAELLLDAFHEVSNKLDPLSRIAMRECLEMQRQYERSHQNKNRPASRPTPSPARDDSRASLSPSSFEVLEDV